MKHSDLIEKMVDAHRFVDASATREAKMEAVLAVVVEEIESLLATGADVSAIIDTLKHPNAPDRPSRALKNMEGNGG